MTESQKIIRKDIIRKDIVYNKTLIAGTELELKSGRPTSWEPGIFKSNIRVYKNRIIRLKAELHEL